MAFVMELCGDSLFSVLHTPAECHWRGAAKRIPEAQTVRWATGVAEAMAFLHAQSPRIVHRDLKSHNLLLAADGRLKLNPLALVTPDALERAAARAHVPRHALARAGFRSIGDRHSTRAAAARSLARDFHWPASAPAALRTECGLHARSAARDAHRAAIAAKRAAAAAAAAAAATGAN